MTTLYDEYMAEQYAEEQRRQRLFNPDRGLYSEYDHKKVVVNGHSIHCTPKDIKSIRGA